MPLLPKFTDAGKALQLRALDGEEIRFTKIQMGSGILGETSYKTFNALLEPKVTIPITDISVSNGYAAIRGYFNNEKLTEGFYYRELGLFAKDPDDDTNEILYCYGNSGEKSGYIAEPDSRLIERSIKIIAVVDDAENVSAVINGSAVYVDFTDMRRAIEEHNADSNAHADMRNQSITYYIDCNSTENDELCDGSYDHPFKSISDIEYAIPDYIKSLRIVLKTTGDYVLYQEALLGYSELENIELAYNGNATNKPIIHGSICFGNLKSVYIGNIDFLCDGQIWSNYYVNLWFDNCNTVWIKNVSMKCNVTGGYGFIDSYSSNIYLSEATVLNANYVISAYDESTVHISECSFETTDESIHCDNSIIYEYEKTGASYLYNSGIIFTPEIMEKITDGTLINHMNSTANPHRVSLDQAQREGGVIDVPHGGTGQETFSEGSLLKGNGKGAVGMISGAGALFAKTAGSPEFGTLPVTMGGLGRTEIPYGALLVGGSKNVDIVEPKVGALYSINTIQPPKYGILPGQYGGTGFSSLARHSLLVGTGNSDVYEELPLGRGALFNSSNNLQYGTLPVYYGGTGTNGLQSSIKAEEVDGARHGHIVIGFGSGPKILICWGRVRTDLNESVIVAFESRCGNYYKDAHYTLVFGGDDIQNGKVTKENTRFIIEAGANRAADWIAIGEVHE